MPLSGAAIISFTTLVAFSNWGSLAIAAPVNDTTTKTIVRSFFIFSPFDFLNSAIGLFESRLLRLAESTQHCMLTADLGRIQQTVPNSINYAYSEKADAMTLAGKNFHVACRNGHVLID